jgi:hypothetical protein
MRLLYGLPALLALFAACQPQAPKQQAAVQDSVSTGPDAPQSAPANYYKRLKGTLAGQPVTMHLVKTGQRAFEAWYAYDKQGIPIELYHKTEDTARLSFTENTMADEDNTFKGTLTAAGYKGTWSNQQKSFEFDLKEVPEGAVLFDVFTCTDSALLLPANPKSPMALATACLVWPVAGANKVTLDSIRSALTPTGATGSPEALVRQGVASFLHDYRGMHDEVDTNELKSGIGASWNWSSYTRTGIVWNAYPLLVFEYSDYSFTGGAHGNGGSVFTVMDLARNKVLHVNDVFRPGYQQALGPALERSFRKKYNVPANEPLNKGYLFEPHINPNDNFYITDKGVVFSYPPYEIAAYAAGQISLFVPFSEVKNYVNEVYLK